MQKQYQVTMVCATGQYRPVSTIVTIEQENDENLLLNPEQKAHILADGIRRVCQQRLWTKRDVAKYGYTKVRARVYEKQEK